MQGYSIKEVSKLIGISVATFYVWSKSGMAPKITRLGRRVIIFEVDYLQWLAKNGVGVGQLAAGND